MTAVTIAVPFAPNEISMDILRGLQGLGAAANVPTAIGILGATFAPGKAKNYAFSTYSAGSSLGSVLGNLFGGVISEYVVWHWVFWVQAILAGLITVAGWYIIPAPEVQVHATTKPQIYVDWIGGSLVTVSLMVLTFALSEGNVVGWSTAYIPVLIVVSLLLLGVFLTWEWYLENKTTRSPLMRVSIYHNKRFAAAQVIMALFFGAFNDYLIFATYL